MDKQGRSVRLFVQVNTGEEEQKGGVNPKDLESLMTYCQDDLNLKIEGLMCIPPADEEPAMHFALLHNYARRFGVKALSMGMSKDYETAIKFGATHVRVGTRIFGTRPPFQQKS